MGFDPNKPYTAAAPFDPNKPYEKPKTQAKARPKAAPPSRGVTGDIAGGLATFYRSIPMLDELNDGFNTAVVTGRDLVMGDTPAGRDVGRLIEGNWKGFRKSSKEMAERFEREHPVAANLTKGAGLAAQIAPALFTGGATVAPSAARVVAPAGRGLMGATARAAQKVGAKALPAARAGTVGGLSAAGAGYADEGTLQERFDKGNEAIPAGVIMGAMTPAVLNAGVKVANRVARAVAPGVDKASATAGRILAGRAPDALAADVKPGMVPFEAMGGGGKSLARAVANVPGPGQEIAEQVLRERSGQAPVRLLGNVARELGDDGAQFHTLLDDLDKIRKTESLPIYKEAYDVGALNSPRLVDLERRGSIQDAKKLAYRLAREEDVNPEALGLGFVENMDHWASDIPPAELVTRQAERARGRGPARAPSRGKSLVKFLADGGGMRDLGGDVTARDGHLWNRGRAYQHRLVSDGPDARTPDELALRAWEHGYFPEKTSRPTERELFDAIDDELRGNPRFAREADQGALDRMRMADEADEMLYRGGGVDDAPSPDDYMGRPEPTHEPALESQMTTQSWDYIKRGLDDIVESYKDPQTGRYEFDEYGRAVNNTLRDLLKELRDLNPTYGRALDAYSGPSKTIDAVRRGRRAAEGRYDPEVVDQMLGKMSLNEREGHLFGVARGAADQIQRNPQAFIRKLTQDGVFNKQIRAAFNNPKAFERFMEDVRSEAAAQKSYNDVLMGSRTTPLREDIDAANLAGEGDDMASRVASSVARRISGETWRTQAARGFLRATERMRQPGLSNPEVSRILGEVLFKGRPAEDVLRQAVAQKLITEDQAAMLLPAISQAVGVHQARPAAGSSAAP